MNDSFGLTLGQSDIYFDQAIQPASPKYDAGRCVRLAANVWAAYMQIVASRDAFGILLVDGGGGGTSEPWACISTLPRPELEKAHTQRYYAAR